MCIGVNGWIFWKKNPNVVLTKIQNFIEIQSSRFRWYSFVFARTQSRLVLLLKVVFVRELWIWSCRLIQRFGPVYRKLMCIISVFTTGTTRMGAMPRVMFMFMTVINWYTNNLTWRSYRSLSFSMLSRFKIGEDASLYLALPRARIAFRWAISNIPIYLWYALPHNWISYRRCASTREII